MADPARLNVLLIHPDQQRHDCLGVTSGGLVRTPNIDALAASGMRFEHAYTPIPVCCPARQCLLSGEWAETHGGLWNYDICLPVSLFESHTWAEDLAAAGYAMAYVGKWHVHPTRSPLEFGFDAYFPLRDYSRWRSEQSLPPTPMSWDEKGIFGNPDNVAPEQAPTHWLARQAVEQIDRYQAEARPWHIRLDFEEPHLPCIPAGRFAEMYRPEDIPPWPSFRDDFAGKPYVQRQQLINWGLEELTWSDWAPAVARYFGIISQVDEAIGIVLAALEDRELTDSTVVVYASDHGDMTGSHRMIDKHYVMYDDVVRVPLIVRWPGLTKPGSVCCEFVNYALDLAATLPMAAGLGEAAGGKGRSLMPLLAGRAPGHWRKEIVSTYNGQQFGLYTQRMIRTKKWKYVWNCTDVDELYDMEADPWELSNLIASDSHQEPLARLRSRLLEELTANGDGAVKARWPKEQLRRGRKLPISNAAPPASGQAE